MARLILAFFAGLTISYGYTKPLSDEQKWAAIEKNREVRRINERRVDACYSQCREQCK